MADVRRRVASVWPKASGDGMTHGATTIATTTHHTVQLRTASVQLVRIQQDVKSHNARTVRWLSPHRILNAVDRRSGSHVSVLRQATGELMTDGATTIAITTLRIVH